MKFIKLYIYNKDIKKIKLNYNLDIDIKIRKRV